MNLVSIDITDNEILKGWASVFDVPLDKLLVAIEAVGNVVIEVDEWLTKNQVNS